MHSQTYWFFTFWKFVFGLMMLILATAIVLNLFPTLFPSWLMIWGPGLSPELQFLFYTLVFVLFLGVLAIILGVMYAFNITPPAFVRNWACDNGIHSFRKIVQWPVHLRARYPNITCMWCDADCSHAIKNNARYNAAVDVIEAQEEKILAQVKQGA